MSAFLSSAQRSAHSTWQIRRYNAATEYADTRKGSVFRAQLFQVVAT